MLSADTKQWSPYRRSSNTMDFGATQSWSLVTNPGSRSLALWTTNPSCWTKCNWLEHNPDKTKMSLVGKKRNWQSDKKSNINSFYGPALSGWWVIFVVKCYFQIPMGCNGEKCILLPPASQETKSQTWAVILESIVSNVLNLHSYQVK